MNGQPLRYTVLITNPQGFHLRPMAAFARLAAGFQSNATVSWDGRSANAKSILELMGLAAPQGSEFTVEVDGPDEAAALDALVALLQTSSEPDLPESSHAGPLEP
jgi:phosphocarrier protein HPr